MKRYLAIILFGMVACIAHGKNTKKTLTRTETAMIIEKAGFQESLVPLMTCLAEKESGLRPRAKNHNKNRTWDHGLLQINDVWIKPCAIKGKDLFDPLKNAQCALIVYRKQGLRAWATYRKYKRTCFNYTVPQYREKIAEYTEQKFTISQTRFLENPNISAAFNLLEKICIPCQKLFFSS